MKKKFVLTLMVVVVAAIAALWVRAGSEGRDGEESSLAGKGGGIEMLPADEITLTVVYDNNPHSANLRSAWGFSCLIDGAERRILFDTGGDAPVLLSNMDSLNIDPGSIDIVVLSHKHEDHTGGVHELLKANPDVTVFVPESFSSSFIKRLEDAGAVVVKVKEPVEVCEAVYSVGQLGFMIKEQSLALSTDRGIIVITGCAHPGIVSIVERAGEVTGCEVLLAMGGFHLGRASDDELNEVVAGFKKAGVAYAAPCHCSGDRARQLFGSAYGDRYIELGVGSVIRGSDLK
jgi:7,8-dihydropterin-6-yl-methyl-4-(beta-D-ribofuranosyl)aminobenzene 5'-phosphate synthase